MAEFDLDDVLGRKKPTPNSSKQKGLDDKGLEFLDKINNGLNLFGTILDKLNNIQDNPQLKQMIQNKANKNNQVQFLENKKKL